MENIKKYAHNFLRSLEKFTKTDMVYLVKGGFWLTFGNLIASGLSFLMGIVFANKLLPETYGTYKFILSILSLLSITTLSGMGNVISQAVSRGFEGSYIKAFRTKVTWGLLGAFASITLAIYYYLNGNHDLGIAFLMATAFIPFMDAFVIYQDYLQGKKLFSTFAISTSISQVVSTLTMIGVVFITPNIFIIFLTYMTTWTVMRGYFFFRTLRHYPPNTKTELQTISYGKHSSFIDIIATLIGSLDQILIFHYLGPIELALYSFAIAPVIQFVSLFRNIPTLAMPKLANRPIPEINILLKKRVLASVGVALTVTIIYYFGSPYLYKILFPQYIDSIPLSRLYALTMLFTIPLTILSPALNAKITYISKKMMYFWNIPGFLSTIFIFAFIQKLGVESVILARLVLLLTTMTISILFWRYIGRKDAEMNRKSGPTLYTPIESLPQNEP